MKGISEFFKRIGGVQAKEIARREAISVAIKEIVDIDVPITSISFKSSTANLKGVSQMIQSVIYTRKKQIIDRANELQKLLLITDIR